MKSNEAAIQLLGDFCIVREVDEKLPALPYLLCYTPLHGETGPAQWTAGYLWFKFVGPRWNELYFESESIEYFHSSVTCGASVDSRSQTSIDLYAVKGPLDRIVIQDYANKVGAEWYLSDAEFWFAQVAIPDGEGDEPRDAVGSLDGSEVASVETLSFDDIRIIHDPSSRPPNLAYRLCFAERNGDRNLARRAAGYLCFKFSGSTPEASDHFRSDGVEWFTHTLPNADSESSYDFYAVESEAMISRRDIDEYATKRDAVWCLSDDEFWFRRYIIPIHSVVTLQDILKAPAGQKAQEVTALPVVIAIPGAPAEPPSYHFCRQVRIIDIGDRKEPVILIEPFSELGFRPFGRDEPFPEHILPSKKPIPGPVANPARIDLWV